MLYENIGDSIKLLFLYEKGSEDHWWVELVLSPEVMFFSFENNDFGGISNQFHAYSLKEVLDRFNVDINDSERVLFVRQEYEMPNPDYYPQIAKPRLFEGIYELMYFKDEEKNNNDYNVYYDSIRDLYVAKRGEYKKLLTARTAKDIKEKILKKQTKTRIIPSDKHLREGINLTLEDIIKK